MNALGLIKYGVGGYMLLRGASDLAGGYFAYNAAKEALRAGVSFVGTAAKTSAQFAVAGGFIYLGYKAACHLHEHYEPVNRLFDANFNEKRCERLQSVLPPLTRVASALPLAALIFSKVYL